MELEKQIKVIEAVASTLELVEVKGAGNWDMMLGCVMNLRQVGKELKEYAGRSDDAEQLRRAEDPAGTV